MTAVAFRETSANRKLSPVDAEYRGGRCVKIAPRPPFVSSTYVAIEPTCSDSCEWKARGCYARAGITGKLSARLDAEALSGRMTAAEVIAEEALAIDAAFLGGGILDDGFGRPRALRLHVGGDVGNELGARILANAATRWRMRGGGPVWTYTHAWREVARRMWGGVSALASVETAQGAEEARARGYVPAIVVARQPRGHRAFTLPGSSARFIPCPAEREGASVTCVECRLCLDDEKLRERGDGISFLAHGRDANHVRGKLRVLTGEQLTMAF